MLYRHWICLNLAKMIYLTDWFLFVFDIVKITFFECIRRNVCRPFKSALIRPPSDIISHRHVTINEGGLCTTFVINYLKFLYNIHTHYWSFFCRSQNVVTYIQILINVLARNWKFLEGPPLATWVVQHTDNEFRLNATTEKNTAEKPSRPIRNPIGHDGQTSVLRKTKNKTPPVSVAFARVNFVFVQDTEQRPAGYVRRVRRRWQVQVQAGQVRPVKHQRPGTAEDARSERRAGRTQERHTVRPFSVCAQAVQDRYVIVGEELHFNAGERSGGTKKTDHLHTGTPFFVVVSQRH